MKKRICSLLMIFLMFVSLTAKANVYKATIKDDYDFGDDFCNGITVVKKDNMSAVINIYGNTVIPFDEREKFLCTNGLVKILGENEKFAYYDRYGNRLTDFMYDSFFVYSAKQNPSTPRRLYHANPGGDGKSDLIPVSRNHKYGFLNSKGEEQIPLQFEYAYGFYEGVAIICADGILSEYGTYTAGKYGFILENGEILKAPNTYWSVSNFKDGYAKADNDIIDKKGKKVFSYNGKNNIASRLDGYCVVKDDSNGMFAVMDYNQNIVIPYDYSSKELAGGQAFIIDQKYVKNDENKIVYTATDGETLRGAGAGYNVYPFIQTNKVVGPYHVLKGLINEKGNTILETKFDYICVYNDDLIYARDAKNNYLYDYLGNQICIVHGNNAHNYGDGMLGLMDFDTKSWSYIPNPNIYPKVYIKNSEIISDVPAKIENGRTYLPMRAIFENLGAAVLWNDKTNTVTATKDDTIISITIGENVLYKNNVPIKIDATAKLENKRTLVPVRAVAEALDCSVFWNTISKQVIIWDFDNGNPHDLKVKEYTDSEIFYIKELIKNPFGTVIITEMSTPHGKNPKIVFIDNNGNEHFLYNDAPRQTLFTYKTPKVFKLDENILKYEVSFPTDAITSIAGGESFILHKAGTYYFEANLETGEDKFVHFEAVPPLYIE